MPSINAQLSPQNIVMTLENVKALKVFLYALGGVRVLVRLSVFHALYIFPLEKQERPSL